MAHREWQRSNTAVGGFVCLVFNLNVDMYDGFKYHKDIGIKNHLNAT